MQTPDRIGNELILATDADKLIIQPILEHIRAGETKHALERIEKLDNPILDRVIVTQPVPLRCDTILKVAIKHNALEIINKLIEKNCNLATRNNFPKMGTSKNMVFIDSAIQLWLDNFDNTSMQISPTFLSIGNVLFNNKRSFNPTVQQLFALYTQFNWQGTSNKDLPTIFYNLLGEEAFVIFLFNPDLEYPIFTLGSADVFDECLKIIFKSDSKITDREIFLVILAARRKSHEFSTDEFFKKLCNYSDIAKKIIAADMQSRKSLAEHEITSLLIPQTSSPMDDFPESEYWRLFVDGEKQVAISEHGWRAYEQREPGCIQNMYNAFQYAKENLKAQLNYEMTDKIHQIATAHFKENENAKNFRDDKRWSGLAVFDTLSRRGLQETEKAPYTQWYKIIWEKNSSVTIMFAQFFPLQDAEIIKIVDEDIIQGYHKKFSASGDDRRKQLQCIIKLASDYARFHPYNDGNNRTAVCILNRELQKHQFPLVILDNPNQLEGHSQAELFTKICEGMQNFLKVKAGQPYPGSKTTKELIRENGTLPIITFKQPFTFLKNFHSDIYNQKYTPRDKGQDQASYDKQNGYTGPGKIDTP